MGIEGEIEEWAKVMLPSDVKEWCKPYGKKPKIVHDSLWGTFRLRPYEVALLDTPLLLTCPHSLYHPL